MTNICNMQVVEEEILVRTMWLRSLIASTIYLLSLAPSNLTSEDTLVELSNVIAGKNLMVIFDTISDRGHEVLFAIFLSLSLHIANVGQLKFEGYYSLFFPIGMCACFLISQWKSWNVFKFNPKKIL